MVFASSKDRRPTTPGSQLHTNFKLDAAGNILLYSTQHSSPPVLSSRSQFPANTPISPTAAIASRNFVSSPTRLPLPPTTTPVPISALSTTSNQHPPRLLQRQLLQCCPPNLHTRCHDPPHPQRHRPHDDHWLDLHRPCYHLRHEAHLAMAYRSDYLPSAVATNSYIMPDRVIYQPAHPAGYPTTWGTFGGIPTLADYEMDPQVVNDFRYLPQRFATTLSRCRPCHRNRQQ